MVQSVNETNVNRRKNKTLEERCQVVYEFILDFIQKNNIGPSYTDIATGTGLTRGNLNIYVNKLVEEGKLVRKANTARGLLPARLRKTSQSLPVPLVGSIAAKNMNPLNTLDLQDSDLTIDIPNFLLSTKYDPQSLYVIRMEGDSMYEVGILDGDYLVIQSGSFYRDGDIVVTYIKKLNSATLKVIKQDKRGSTKLQPKSHRHPQRVEDVENNDIQGRVIAILRKY